MSELIISACICCRNASERIKDTLLSLIFQTADKSNYEIIVIDNASEDIFKLKQIVCSVNNDYFCNIKLFEENNIGLSFARNRAVAESNSKYVYFIDDDAIAINKLIEGFINNIKKYDPDVIGGNVIPLFEKLPPKELDFSYWRQWSLIYIDDNDRWLKKNEYFIGTNIGAKRKILLKNRFNEYLGRKNDLLIGGEEWFLSDSKYMRRFVYDSYVLHKVTHERFSYKYFVKRFTGHYKTVDKKINFVLILLLYLKEFITQTKMYFIKLYFRFKIVTNLFL